MEEQSSPRPGPRPSAPHRPPENEQQSGHRVQRSAENQLMAYLDRIPSHRSQDSYRRPLLRDLASACSDLFATVAQYFPSPPSSPSPDKYRPLSSASSVSSVASFATSLGFVTGLRHEAGRLRRWTELMREVDLELFSGGEHGGGLFLEPVVAKTVIVLLGMAAQLERLVVEAGAVSVADLPDVQNMRRCIDSFVPILEDTVAMNDAEAAVLAAASVDTTSSDIAVAVESLSEMNNCLLCFTTALTVRATKVNGTGRSRKKRNSITHQQMPIHPDLPTQDKTRAYHRHSRTDSSDNYLMKPDDPPPNDEKRTRITDTKMSSPSSITYIAVPPKKTPKSRSSCAKSVLIGAGQCGKTSAISRFTAQKFSPIYVPTTFADHLAHAGSLQDIEMTIIDTAGQDQYDRLRPLSYPEANVVVVCFSVGCRQSLSEVRDKWLPEYQHFAPGLPLVLLGLKSDLRPNSTYAPDEPRKRRRSLVSYSQGLGAARAAGAVAYAECSAQSGHGVREAFDMVADVAVGWMQGERRGDSCVVM